MKRAVIIMSVLAGAFMIVSVALLLHIYQLNTKINTPVANHNAQSSQQAVTTGQYTPINTKDMYDMINNIRQDNGLNVLSTDPRLEVSACAKANDMVINNYWSHTSPSGTEFWEFIVASGLKYSYAGENLASGYKTARGTVDGWMGSTTHRDNILGDYRYTGLCNIYTYLPASREGEINLTVNHFAR